MIKFEAKYNLWQEVIFYDYTLRQCGIVSRGGKVKKKPSTGCIIAVTFTDGNNPFYSIQKTPYDGEYKLTMSVSEEHIIGVIDEN